MNEPLAVASNDKIAMDSFARAWISARRKAGRTYEEIGAELGVSKAAVHNVEDSSRGAGPSIQKGLARVLYGGSADKLREAAAGTATDFSAPPTRSATRTVHVGDRYPTRPAALAALRAQGVAEELVGVIASLRAHSEEDPGVGYWLVDAVREARALIVASRAAATEEDDAFTTPKIKGSRRK